MTGFILNKQQVTTDAHPGTPLLEVIRKEFRLNGTKLACGEGECGACTVLVGTLQEDGVRYRSVTACITPLANVENRHVLTIEGISDNGLTPVQQAMVDTNGTQCGFCTPGFVMSLTGELLNATHAEAEALVAAMDGNICRCTGYASIKRAAVQLARQFGDGKAWSLTDLCAHRVVPEWMQGIGEQLAMPGAVTETSPSDGLFVGGGTDLYVQRPHQLHRAKLVAVAQDPGLKGISRNGDACIIGAAETMASLQASTLLNEALPGFHAYFDPIGSTQIRNTATLAGNLVNASPIGDMTIMFLALDATLTVQGNSSRREIRLRDFYLGYKQLARTEDEYIVSLRFDLPPPSAGFHFERVCKRKYLDVASVNSACLLQVDDERPVKVALSMGGVAPVPLYLTRTSAFLSGQPLDPGRISQAVQVLQDEISPISDIRGSADYKRLLARQQLFVHLAQLAPAFVNLESMLIR